MRNIVSTIERKTGNLLTRAKASLLNERGDFYISDGVKIIIGVVRAFFYKKFKEKIYDKI